MPKPTILPLQADAAAILAMTIEYFNNFLFPGHRPIGPEDIEFLEKAMRTYGDAVAREKG